MRFSVLPLGVAMLKSSWVIDAPNTLHRATRPYLTVHLVQFGLIRWNMQRPCAILRKSVREVRFIPVDVTMIFHGPYIAWNKQLCFENFYLEVSSFRSFFDLPPLPRKELAANTTRNFLVYSVVSVAPNTMLITCLPVMQLSFLLCPLSYPIWSDNFWVLKTSANFDINSV